MSRSEPSRRFRVDSVEPGDDGLLDPGAAVHRHLRVLRAAVGEAVLLFDGRGGEVRAEIATIDDDGARLRVIESVRREVESPLDTCLVQAVPVRAARMETIVRQLTELGVQRIVPVLAQRSQQANTKETARARKAERWQRIADSAAEQCGRTRVPRIDSPCPFDQLAWDTLPAPLLIADPGAPGAPGAPGGTRSPEAGNPLSVARDRAPRAATVMIGPEGGWTEAEVEAARAHGATPLQLGPRVLRADSAGVVAIALLQYLWGDLRGAAESREG